MPGVYSTTLRSPVCISWQEALREIFEKAIQHKATALLFAHNHPSGTLKPSAEDIRITRQMVAAGKVMDIKVLDHFIVAGNAALSFAERGLI